MSPAIVVVVEDVLDGGVVRLMLAAAEAVEAAGAIEAGAAEAGDEEATEVGMYESCDAKGPLPVSSVADGCCWPSSCCNC